jgi:hypothetical protein
LPEIKRDDKAFQEYLLNRKGMPKRSVLRHFGSSMQDFATFDKRQQVLQGAVSIPVVQKGGTQRDMNVDITEDTFY